MSTFRKSGECPTSRELLDFQSGDLSVLDGKWIRIHLIDCEFCTAEVEFYEHFPQSDDAPEELESPVMPASLHELAEALIGKRSGPGNFEQLFSNFNDFSIDED